MVPPQQQGDLFAGQARSCSTDTVAINARCTLRTKDGHRAVLVAGVPIAHFGLGDRMAEAYAMVTLIDQAWADQAEVARAFGCSTRSVRRMQRRFEEGGLPALVGARDSRRGCAGLVRDGSDAYTI